MRTKNIENLTGNWNWNDNPIKKHISIEIKQNIE